MKIEDHEKMISAAFDLGLLQKAGKTNELLTSLTDKLAHELEQQRNAAETEKIRCGALFELNKKSEQLWDLISTNPNDETSRSIVYAHIQILDRSTDLGILNQKNFSTLEYKNLCDQYIKKMVSIEMHKCFKRVERSVKDEIKQLEDAEKARKQKEREEFDKKEVEREKKILRRIAAFCVVLTFIAIVFTLWVNHENNLCRNDECGHKGLIELYGDWKECPECGTLKKKFHLLGDH